MNISRRRNLNEYEIILCKLLLKWLADYLYKSGLKPYRVGVEFGSDFNGMGLNYFYAHDELAVYFDYFKD